MAGNRWRDELGDVGKTRTLEHRKGAAPTLFFSASLGSAAAEALFELNESVALYFSYLTLWRIQT